jgi:hypothetical protein
MSSALSQDERARVRAASSALCAAAERLRGITTVKNAALGAYLQHGDPASEGALAAATLAVRGAMVSLRDHAETLDELERTVLFAHKPPPPKKKRRTTDDSRGADV